MRAPSARQVGLLCLLVTSFGWGLNFPLVKIVLREWPPLTARGVAGVLAACGLMALAAARGERLAVARALRARLLAAAALNVFAWMGFSTVAMRWLPAGEVALLVYTMPIWAALLAWPMRGERPTLRSLAALSLGVAGTGLLFARPGAAAAAGALPGAALALAAAFLFALGTVAWRTPLPLPPLASTAWQVGLGCLPMLAAGLLFEAPGPRMLSPAGWAAMAYMTVVPMGLCYLTWFAALRRLPPATASMATLLTPVVGVLAAAIGLGEPLGARELAALALTLGGVALALRRPNEP